VTVEPSSTFKIADLLDAILAFYKRKADHQQIRVHRRYDSEGSIRAFSGPLRQVFTNLIANALEAMPNGGDLTVHLYEGRDWMQPHRRGFRVSVADSGSGIAPPERERALTHSLPRRVSMDRG
jgi:signal transduction histidine kinase